MKKTLMVVLILSVVSGLSVWAGGGGEEASKPPSRSAVGPLARYDPPIKLVAVREVNDTYKYDPGEDITNNAWQQAYLDELGIEVEYMWIASGADQFRQKMNVMVASGDLPDFLPINDPLVFRQLAEADLLENLDPYYDDYVSPALNEVLTKQGPAVLEAARVNGELVAVPRPNTAVDGAPMIWIKQDWLDKYDLDPPTSMDEAIKLAYFFAKNDPDGNGKDDSFGLALNKNLWGGFAGLEGFFNGFGAYPTIWHRDATGKVVYGAVQPAAKNALAALARAYADGIIDPEFGVKPGGKVGETIAQNKLGMEYGAMWNSIWPLNGNIDNDETAYWQSYPAVFVDGVDKKLQVSINISNYYAMRKGYDYPEVVYKLMNFWLEKGWGVGQEPEKFFWAENGIEKFKYALAGASPYGKNLIAYHKVNEALKTGDSSKLNGEEMIYYQHCVQFQEGDRSQFGHWGVFGYNASYMTIQNYLDNDMLVYNVLIGVPVQAWLDNGSTLSDLLLQDYTKIITGEEPVEYFDTFVKNWMDLGGREATAQMNERYPK